MEETVKSEGKCLFCGKTFAKAGINRHLATHLKVKTTGGKSGNSFLVKVETCKRWGTTPYFLSLWMDGGATMENLDGFLRDIWLECCGHLSAFFDPAIRKNRGGMFGMMNGFEDDEDDEEENDEGYDFFSDELPGQIPMRKKAKDVLCKGKVLDYEYDFGSTTRLAITVIEQYPVKAEEKIVLLSRNEPPKITCTICKKAVATQICPFCCYDELEALCDKCAPKHTKICEDFDEESFSSVANSPRMGVCGYEGGVIDTERDRYVGK